MTDHTINENETDNIMGKKENENLEDLFAEVEQWHSSLHRCF